MKDFDPQLALERFKRRKLSNQAKMRIDNSTLSNGSPLYYYCKCCGDLSDVIPEAFTGRPKTICDPCEGLLERGLILPNGDLV